MCLLDAASKNSLMRTIHGNIEFTFSNVTSARNKVSTICKLATHGVHFLCETKHDNDTVPAMHGEAAAYGRAVGLCANSFDFVFGDVPFPAGRAGIAACVGPSFVKRTRTVPPRPDSLAEEWVRAGRLSLFHLVVNCGCRHGSDAGEASVFVFMIYGVVSKVAPNNDLLLAVETWASELSYAPVFIGGDFNIVVEQSHVLQRWFASGLFHDLFYEAFCVQGQEPPTTSFTDLGECRIDFCWANDAACCVVQACSLQKNVFATHHSLQVTLNLSAFVQVAFRRHKPLPLDLVERCQMSDVQLLALRIFREVDWESFVNIVREGSAGEGVRRCALTSLFEIWAERCERFLVARAESHWHPRFHQR